MKLLKKILKFTFIISLLFVIAYYGIYFYAKTTDKLNINSASGYYMYDSNNELIDITTNNTKLPKPPISDNKVSNL